MNKQVLQVILVGIVLLGVAFLIMNEIPKLGQDLNIMDILPDMRPVGNSTLENLLEEPVATITNP